MIPVMPRRASNGKLMDQSEAEPHQAADLADLARLTEQAAGRLGRSWLAAVERVAAAVDARERTGEPAVAE